MTSASVKYSAAPLALLLYLALRAKYIAMVDIV